MQAITMQFFQASRLTSGSRVACIIYKNENVPRRRYRNFQCHAAKDAGKLLRDGKSKYLHRHTTKDIQIVPFPLPMFC